MMRRLLLTLPLALASALFAAEPPPRPRPLPDRFFTPASAVAPALADCLAQPEHVRGHLRYVSGYHLRDEDLPKADQTLRFVVNSLSRSPIMTPPAPLAGGRLWRVNLLDYRIDPQAWDDLIRLGSGRQLTPEPYFYLHAKTTKKKWVSSGQSYWPGGYKGGTYYAPGNYDQGEWQTVTHTALKLAPWLPTAESDALAELSETRYPLVRFDWFVYFSLLEPRYHELIGLPTNDLAGFRKLAVADERLADREGVQVRGAVLFSEVAEHNRALERTPTILRHGRGYFWESLDFEQSVDRDDVLADLLNDRPDARELIFSLRNGLQGYGVVDAAGKRLDRAAVNVARDKRTPLQSVEVEVRNCIICHARGMIELEDEVRHTARDGVALALRDLEKTDRRKARRIVDRYFAADIAELISQDQLNYEAAVRSCNGLAAAANALQLQAWMVEYERPLVLDDFSLETGYPPDVVKGVIERGTALDHTLVRAAKKKGRKARRDQFEAAHGQLMQLLIQVPVKTEGKGGGKGKGGKQ